MAWIFSYAAGVCGFSPAGLARLILATTKISPLRGMLGPILGDCRQVLGENPQTSAARTLYSHPHGSWGTYSSHFHPCQDGTSTSPCLFYVWPEPLHPHRKSAWYKNRSRWRAVLVRQTVCKPGSVLRCRRAGHLSRPAVARRLERFLWYRPGGTPWEYSLGRHLLAADRVYLLPMSPWGAVGSYPTRFTFAVAKSHGSIVSVALSLGSRPVAVSNCPSLYCPDFPLSARIATDGQRPADRLATRDYTTW